MKKNISWLNAIIIVFVAVYLVDLNISWYHNPANNIPVLKYTIIGISIILFLVVLQIMIGKRNSKNK